MPRAGQVSPSRLTPLLPGTPPQCCINIRVIINQELLVTLGCRPRRSRG